MKRVNRLIAKRFTPVPLEPPSALMAHPPAPNRAVSSSCGRISSQSLWNGLILTMISRWLRGSGSFRKATVLPVK